MGKKLKLDLNPEFQQAFTLMESDVPFLFVTGRAGTGKSTLLNFFRERTKKRCAYLAPTGVAALNIQGETVHSFFRFSPGMTTGDAKKKAKNADPALYRRLDAIVLDEISMVRADILDCMDIFLKTLLKKQRPFGGIRLIAIGDLYQLPPVVTFQERDAFKERYQTPYFFSSDVLSELIDEHALKFVELEKIYRQSEQSFIELLNGVRNRSISEEALDTLNKRVLSRPFSWAGSFIYLTTTNAAADEINQANFARLKTKHRSYQGVIHGDFPQKDLPTENVLTLAQGARVMFVKNDPLGQWVNGTLGRVESVFKDHVMVLIDSEDEPVRVEPVTWSLYRSTYNTQSRELDQEKFGNFTQIPLRLAWAITIHKSQGKTFERVMVDFGRGAFAAGQVYVALSRCRTFEGLILTKAVTKSQLYLDYRVMKFVTDIQYRNATERLSHEKKIQLLSDAISSEHPLQMTYLKAKDEKSTRIISPLRLYESEYNGHPFLALDAYCHLRCEERIFNVERILTLEEHEV
jgi:ATP-dependent exoDNAse (exonuclease V) alpha subunit